ncbi:hypothetical protein RIF29_21988 [Crotalaria pallida]|uniref:Uncharacterized protein n=1 Tax=Crotalaria pallida TaxID=3830 RepID=A0AAN9F3K6_CROPI
MLLPSLVCCLVKFSVSLFLFSSSAFYSLSKPHFSSTSFHNFHLPPNPKKKKKKNLEPFFSPSFSPLSYNFFFPVFYFLFPPKYTLQLHPLISNPPIFSPSSVFILFNHSLFSSSLV